jgi:hypothetical protein
MVYGVVSVYPWWGSSYTLYSGVDRVRSSSRDTDVVLDEVVEWEMVRVRCVRMGLLGTERGVEGDGKWEGEIDVVIQFLHVEE